MYFFQNSLKRINENFYTGIYRLMLPSFGTIQEPKLTKRFKYRFDVNLLT